MPITVSLQEEAEQYLRSKIMRKFGHGRFLSSLLLAEQAREETRQLERERRVLSSRDEWEKSGACVD